MNISPTLMGTDTEIHIGSHFTVVSQCSIFPGCFYFLNEIKSKRVRIKKEL